jgi:hypothetical protein
MHSANRNHRANRNHSPDQRAVRKPETAHHPRARFSRLHLGVSLIALIACASTEVMGNQPPLPVTEQPAPPSSQPSSTQPSKLIKLGPDMPNTWELETLMPRVDASPFDGVVLRMPQSNRTFNASAFPDSDFDQHIQRVKDARQRAPSSKYADSFFLVWITPYGEWDWFNDAHWAGAEKNLRNIARVVKATGVKGIFFDQEPYNDTRPWGFQHQPNRGTRDFAAYQAQIQKRGAQFMRALQEGAPGLTLFTTRLFSIPPLLDLWKTDPNADRATTDKVLAGEAFYGLWPAFARGMLEAVAPNVTIVDGNELSYYHHNARLFEDDARRLTTPPTAVLQPDLLNKYKTQVQIGHAVYPDGMLNPTDNLLFLGYFLTLEQRWSWHEHNVYHALRTGRGYTFYYSEIETIGNWWKPTSDTQGRLERLANDIRNAKRKLRTNQPLGFEIASFMDGPTGAVAKFEARVRFAGIIRKSDGTTVGDVKITPSSPGISCKDSNKFGVYTCVSVNSWSGVITPSKTGTTFTPSHRTYTKVTSNQFGQGFTAAP